MNNVSTCEAFMRAIALGVKAPCVVHNQHIHPATSASCAGFQCAITVPVHLRVFQKTSSADLGEKSSSPTPVIILTITCLRGTVVQVTMRWRLSWPPAGDEPRWFST